MFDKASAKRVGKEAVDLLKALEKCGYEISLKGGSFSETELTLKISFKVKGAPNKEEKYFKEYAEIYGFKPEDLGKKFVISGVEYKITGLAPSRRKFPISAIRVKDGAPFKFPASAILGRDKLKLV